MGGASVGKANRAPGPVSPEGHRTPGCSGLADRLSAVRSVEQQQSPDPARPQQGWQDNVAADIVAMVAPVWTLGLFWAVPKWRGRNGRRNLRSRANDRALRPDNNGRWRIEDDAATVP